MVEQTSSTFDFANKSEAVKLFHDYVIQRYEGRENNLTEVASQFHKDVGCKLVSFLGKFSSYEKLDEFTNWFMTRRVSKTEVMIKAKSGQAIQIPSVNIISAIKAKVKPDMLRPVVPRFPVVSRLEFGDGLHFFGMFYPAVRKVRDYYGQDQNYSEVRYVKVERELELRQVNVELGPSFRALRA